jgi:hypothetical protein
MASQAVLTASSLTASSILALAKDPPTDVRVREEMYQAVKTLFYSLEDWQDLVNRLSFGVRR